MRYSDADAYAMQSAVGSDADVGEESMKVVPLFPFDVDYGSGSMEAEQFSLTIAHAEIARLSLTEGESGTVITYRGADYRILNIEDDDTGFATLHLGVA